METFMPEEDTPRPGDVAVLPRPVESERFKKARTELAVAKFMATLVPHGGYNDCLQKLNILHLAGRTNREKPRGMLITGASGTGKSTIAKQYESYCPSVEEEERSFIPVLRVELPGQPTAKEIAGALLRALGDPFDNLGTAEVRMKRVRSLLKACGVEMIIFDEMQHLTDNLDKRQRSIAADTLKNLMNVSGLPCVFIGTKACQDYFVENQQLGRRCSPKVTLAPFSIATSEAANQFGRALMTLDAQLPMGPGSVLVDPKYTAAIYHATHGLLG